MKFLIPLISLFGLVPIRFHFGVDKEEGGGSVSEPKADADNLTPVQRFEAAQERISKLEEAAEGHETRVSALEQEVETANQRAEAAESRVSELESQVSGLEAERDQARKDLEAAEALAEEAETRATAAEGRLAADPRFAHVHGEGEAPPAGGDGEEANSDDEWHKRYMAASPAEKTKMWQEREKAKAEAEATI